MHMYQLAYHRNIPVRRPYTEPADEPLPILRNTRARIHDSTLNQGTEAGIREH